MIHRLTSMLVALSLICLVSLADSEDKPLKKFRWGVTSLSASQWIPWIAKEAKLYEKYGLEAELVLLRGSGQSAQAIVGNSILGCFQLHNHASETLRERVVNVPRHSISFFENRGAPTLLG